jgi:hypothetical protein
MLADLGSERQQIGEGILFWNASLTGRGKRVAQQNAYQRNDGMADRRRRLELLSGSRQLANRYQRQISARSKIQILCVSRGWRGCLQLISGKFVVTLNDGRKIEGNFSAKHVKPPTPWI